MKTPSFVFDGKKIFILNKASGIHPLIPFIDGMKIIKFPEFKPHYLVLDDVIEWHENEIKRPGGSVNSQHALDLLKPHREKLIKQYESEATHD